MKLRYLIFFAFLMIAPLSVGVCERAAYPLKEDLAFKAAEVNTLRMELYRPGDEQILTIREKSVTAAVLDGLGKMEVRPVPKRRQPKNGGVSVQYTITLKNGDVWRYDGVHDVLTDPAGKQRSYEIVKGYENGIMLFDDLIAVPRLRVKLNDSDGQVYQRDFSYNGNVKQVQGQLPWAVGREEEPNLSLEGPNTCTLTFGVTKPTKLTATLYSRQSDEGMETLDDGAGLPVERDRVTLPGQAGKYCLTLDAQFPGGTVNYLIAFSVSDLPAFFENEDYVNGENNVLVRREDKGVALAQSGGNWNYVNFLKSLSLQKTLLLPEGTLPVRNPFSLTFEKDGTAAKFHFSDQEIYYDGKIYTTPYPERIAALFSGVEAEVGMEIPLCDFLTKEGEQFTGAYPDNPEDAEETPDAVE